MLDRLRRSYDRERRFVADASHELRTPIAVIKAELEGALRRRPADPDVRDALTAAVDECDHLAQLAEDLLVVARAGDGALPVRPRTLEAAELLDGRARCASPAAPPSTGARSASRRRSGLELDADEQRLGQALGNLVDNALRHGAGRDHAARRAAARRRSSSRSPTRAPASSGDLAARAFERFARGDAARTRGGAGLGLAIVRAIAEAHGGAAELAGGAAVRIRIPSQGDPSSRPYVAPMPTQGGTT